MTCILLSHKFTQCIRDSNNWWVELYMACLVMFWFTSAFTKDLSKTFQTVLTMYSKRKVCVSKHVWNSLDLFFTEVHIFKSFVCSHSKIFNKHLLLFKCLDCNRMNFSHFLSMAPCWLPSPHPQGHIKHAHTSIWARFSNPHGDTSQMLVKGEMLTFVGSKHLLQSKHRLFLLNHPQQPSHNCF